MESHILKLTLSYLLVGFLIIVLVMIRRSPERRGVLTMKKLMSGFALVLLIFYVLPFCVFLLVHFFKVVVVEKYTMYQFKEYACTVLFNQFNGYYVELWNWFTYSVKSRLR
jgi:hypothetical protein